jgi:hypothetical protein
MGWHGGETAMVGVAATKRGRAWRLRWLPGAVAVGLIALSVPSRSLRADEMFVTAGRGPQPGSEQRNETVGFDYSFYRLERSARQHISIGVSYTRLETNAAANDSLYAISVYPQITLYPSATSRIAAHSPRWAAPFFFVRALGASYISDGTLGGRRQAEHFAFQAQVGVGVQLNPGAERRAVIGVSWKHLSNANLYRHNDGIDVPLVINVGMTF